MKPASLVNQCWNPDAFSLTEHDGVILKVAEVDNDQCGLEEQHHQRKVLRRGKVSKGPLGNVNNIPVFVKNGFLATLL